MSTILSKLWPGLSLAIIALLSCLLIRDCRTKPVPIDTGALVTAGYDSAQRVDTPQIVAWKARGDSLEDLVDSMHIRQIVMQFTLDTMGDNITHTMVGLDQAKIQHDTVQVTTDCDVLEALVKKGIPAVEGYTHLSDTIVNNLMAENSIQDSIIAKLTILNKMAGNTITAQQLDYSILNLDDKTKTAQLKIYKPVALGGMAAVVAFLVLKFIVH